MGVLAFLVIFCVASSVLSSPLPTDYEYEKFKFFPRELWGGRPPSFVNELATPVPYVVIHHSYQPPACSSFEQCAFFMRIMQDMHQITQGWADIGYNFAVGSDGAVYEGRGWRAVGAHAVGFNVRSIGIVLIGDWVSKVPPQQQLEAVKSLIEEGVKLGYICSDYDLIGHRQTSATECPGQALFDEISTWDRFKPSVQ